MLGRDYSLEGEYKVMSDEYLLSRGTCCDSGCRNCPYGLRHDKSSPRIISLVPSWTETLVHAGANLVGRSRFCVHPQDYVAQIPTLGGTKNFNTDEAADLAPDFLLLDKEENTKEMAQQSPCPLLTSHVESVASLGSDLGAFSEKLNLPKLQAYSQRLRKIKPKSLGHIPGVLDWWRKPADDLRGYAIVYLIWKDPFMSISRPTYIGDVLSYFGWGEQLWAKISDSKYPQFDFSDLPPNSLLLFSSEPFPFRKYKDEFLSKYNFPAGLVDGEAYGWFGIRGLRFLEDHLL